MVHIVGSGRYISNLSGNYLLCKKIRKIIDCNIKVIAAAAFSLDMLS